MKQDNYFFQKASGTFGGVRYWIPFLDFDDFFKDVMRTSKDVIELLKSGIGQWIG